MRPDCAARSCILTVDVEEWFHGLDLAPSRLHGLESRVDANVDTLLELLAEHRAHATFFVLGRVADERPELVARILAGGHEIGSHGYEHEFVYRRTPDVFARDLDRSLSSLARSGAPAVESFRAPFFSITKESLWAFDRLGAAGIQRDSSIMPAPNPRYGIPRAPLEPHRIRTRSGYDLIEAPVSCVETGGLRIPFGGGFYLRFFSLAMVRAAMEATLAAGRPAVLYMHPWELDPAPPRISLPCRIRTTHYLRLESTRSKLAALAGQFTFTALRDLELPSRDDRCATPRPVTVGRIVRDQAVRLASSLAPGIPNRRPARR